MNGTKLIEPVGFYVSGIIGLFSFIFYVVNSKMFLGSLYAGLMTAFLAWIAYVVTRLVILSFK